MPRAVLSLIAGLTLAVTSLVAASTGSVSGAIESGAPTTTVLAAPPSTAVLGGEPVPTSVLVTTTVPRGGAAEGSIAKPEAAGGWSIARLVTLTALGVVALAAMGYAFGRFRSTPPIHPDLVRQSE